MLTRYTVAEESGEEAGACLGIEQVLARHRLIEAGGGRVSEDYPFLWFMVTPYRSQLWEYEDHPLVWLQRPVDAWRGWESQDNPLPENSRLDFHSFMD